MLLLPILLAQADVFGKITAPTGVDAYNAKATGGIGILLFLSNVIKVLTIVAGIWVLFNFLMAGYTYITAQGDASAANKVKDQLTNSIIGLAIIVGAYKIIAIVSFFLFGDAGFILNPTIPGPV